MASFVWIGHIPSQVEINISHSCNLDEKKETKKEKKNHLKCKWKGRSIVSSNANGRIMLPVMTIIVFHPYIYQTVGCKVFNDSTFAMRVKRPKHVQMDLQKKTPTAWGRETYIECLRQLRNAFPYFSFFSVILIGNDIPALSLSIEVHYLNWACCSLTQIDYELNGFGRRWQ